MALIRGRRRGLLLNTALVMAHAALGVTSYLVVTRNDAQPAAATATVAVSLGAGTSSVSSSGTVQSVRTATPRFTASATVTAVLVSVGQHVSKGQALARIDASTAQRALRIAEYNLTAAEDGVTAAEETALLATVAAISLLIGGIGITNIMPVTVTERTRADRHPQGARRTPVVVLSQFRAEATLLSLAGGGLGVGAVLIASRSSCSGSSRSSYPPRSRWRSPSRSRSDCSSAASPPTGPPRCARSTHSATSNAPE